MPRSERLRLNDVRTACRLVGECRELGDDSLTWQRHLLTESAKFIGAQVGLGGCEQGMRSKEATFGPLETISVGWGCPADEQVYLRFLSDFPHENDPLFRLGRPRERPVVQTWSREQVVGAREWYASAMFNDYMRKANIDLGIVSWHLLDGSMTHAVSYHQAIGDRRFSQRERRLVRFLHQEVGRLIGNALAGPWTANRSALSPRLRETLDFLLEGDSEKQAARRMGVRFSTAHEYVKMVYRHFGVSSRAELLALFLRRFRGTQPGA